MLGKGMMILYLLEISIRVFPITSGAEMESMKLNWPSPPFANVNFITKLVATNCTFV